MDKTQLLRKWRNRVGAQSFIPLGAKLVPESLARRQHAEMAHWSDSLSEATWRAAQGLRTGFWGGCLDPEGCMRASACLLVWRRARAISNAKYALRAPPASDLQGTHVSA